MIQIWLRKCIAWLQQYTQPTEEELVTHLILHTASLELAPKEFVQLAPIKGTCGPIHLSGNSLPVFEYRVFEKDIMEFIHVRVELSKPDRIQYISSIDSTTAPERHGEKVETTDKHREPFEKLSEHLFRYFPLYKTSNNYVYKDPRVTPKPKKKAVAVAEEKKE